MNASTAIATSAPITGSEVTVERRLATAIWLSLTGLLVAVSILMVARRLGGAFVAAPSGWMLVGAAVGGSLIAAFLRSTEYLVLSTEYTAVLNLHRRMPLLASLLFAIPGAACFLLLASLTLWGTPIGLVVVAWILALGSETASWLMFVRSRRGTQPIAPVATEDIEAELEAEIPAGLVQQITRSREANYESIHAMVRAEIPAGDRLAVVHLAFCPPLESAPDLTVHAVDADDVEVRITQAETFGTRLEIQSQVVGERPRTVLVEVLGKADLHEAAQPGT